MWEKKRSSSTTPRANTDFTNPEREHVAKLLTRNSSVILAVGAFLATPLLRFANEPPGGFHSWGRAKIGKTLAVAVGQSIYGKPYRQGAGSDTFGFTWESTPNRLEQRAALRHEVGLGLDEIGVGDKKSIAPAVYKLAGGFGKGRMNRDELDFNIWFYSTGEASLANFLPNIQPGQMVRLRCTNASASRRTWSK
jgi:putative DNA primase/helicase